MRVRTELSCNIVLDYIQNEPGYAQVFIFSYKSNSELLSFSITNNDIICESLVVTSDYVIKYGRVCDTNMVLAAYDINKEKVLNVFDNSTHKLLKNKISDRGILRNLSKKV